MIKGQERLPDLGKVQEFLFNTVVSLVPKKSEILIDIRRPAMVSERGHTREEFLFESDPLNRTTSWTFEFLHHVGPLGEATDPRKSARYINWRLQQIWSGREFINIRQEMFSEDRLTDGVAQAFAEILATHAPEQGKQVQSLLRTEDKNVILKGMPDSQTQLRLSLKTGKGTSFVHGRAYLEPLG